MKTPQEVQKHINRYIEKRAWKGTVRSSDAKSQNLKQLKVYLETLPSEDYLQSELDRINVIIKRIEELKNINTWEIGNMSAIEGLQYPQIISMYKRAMGLPALKKKANALEFLLSPEEAS